METVVSSSWNREMAYKLGIAVGDECNSYGIIGGWMNAEAAARNGNDLMLEMGLQRSVSKLKKAYKSDPVGIAWALRDCAHNICYAIVNVIMEAE